MSVITAQPPEMFVLTEDVGACWLGVDSDVGSDE